MENNEETKELQHLHNKMIFDCMNDALEYFRPFDIRGRPLPWKLNQRKLTYSEINEENMDIVLEQAKNKVVEISLSMCGYLNEERENNQEIFEREVLQQIRLERLEKVLANEVY